jgi:uncharacterized membrane protein (UPF0127 family)
MKTIKLTNTKTAKTITEQFIGLMLKKNIDYTLIIELNKPSKTLASIHTLFMKQPIDIYFLNEKKQLTEKTTLKPWKLNYTPKQKTKYIIETQTGLINPKIKQKITW